MNYNIFDRTAPTMPRPAKGTEFCKLLLSQASRDMREPLIPMAFPALAAHLTGVEFMYSGNQYYELCGQMGHLIGTSGIGKAQLTRLVEAIMCLFRDHDETEYKKLVDWQRQVKTRDANKKKPERPDVAFWFPPVDLTNPAFIQNAMALEKMGGRTHYLNLPEAVRGLSFHMYPDRDEPGERLFLQLQQVLPSLVHHQLPLGCKDFSDYYLTTKNSQAADG